MNERIKILRNTLNLSMEKFGAKIGLTKSAISKFESGANPSAQTIILICREFNVNEVWLRTGEGEMFLELEEDEYSKAAALLSDDPLVKSCLIEYSHLDDDAKKLFKDFITKLYKRMEQME